MTLTERQKVHVWQFYFLSILFSVLLFIGNSLNFKFLKLNTQWKVKTNKKFQLSPCFILKNFLCYMNQLNRKTDMLQVQSCIIFLTLVSNITDFIESPFNAIATNFGFFLSEKNIRKKKEVGVAKTAATY